MKFLQKLGKALMLPVACLPICGILMGIGYALCPATMQGGDITGIGNQIGFFLVKAGGALIDNMALLFVIGVGVGMAEKHDGTGGLAALASWLMITNLLSTAVVTTIMPSIAKNADATLAFDKISNPFIGILAGVIGSMCYNKFKDTKLPDWLSFFSGKRCVAIIAGVVSIIVSVVLLFVWPVVFTALITVGQSIAKMGAVGAGIYAFLNRLLIPTGLHHALNNVFWFDTIGLGDLTHFWAGETSKNAWMIIPLGIAAFIVFYVVFRIAITKFDLKTPGREDDDLDEENITLANDDFTAMAAVILEGLGGSANVKSIDNCITRLRLEINDDNKIDEAKIKSSGAAGIIRPGKGNIQVIIGPKVQFVADEMEKLCK